MPAGLPERIFRQVRPDNVGSSPTTGKPSPSFTSLHGIEPPRLEFDVGDAEQDHAETDDPGKTDSQKPLKGIVRIGLLRGIGDLDPLLGVQLQVPQVELVADPLDDHLQVVELGLPVFQVGRLGVQFLEFVHGR